MFAKIDRWMIERGFEPLAHWIERTFGVTNYTIAKFMTVVWTAAMVAQAQMVGGAIYWTIATIGVLGTPISLWVLSDKERAAKSGVANAEKFMVWYQFLRLTMCVTLIPATLMAVYAGFEPFYFAGLSFWLELSFRACDTPKPWAANSLAFAGRT